MILLQPVKEAIWVMLKHETACDDWTDQTVRLTQVCRRAVGPGDRSHRRKAKMAKLYVRFLDWILDRIIGPQEKGPLPPPQPIDGPTGPRPFY